MRYPYSTSSLDTKTEQLIQEAITRLMTGKTILIIAHRLNTVQQADQIIFISEGEVKESGSHNALLQKEGFYKRFISAYRGDS